MKPQIIGYEPGYHNQDLEGTIHRLNAEGSYKDQSVIMIVPALASVATKAASAWLNMYFPPNQKVIKLFCQNMEVGSAYDETFQQILAHPEMSKFKYVLTVEADNAPPPDGVVKLIKQMESHPEYHCIGGLYFCKGEGGCAHIWGDMSDPVVNYRPQVPIPDALMECYGTSMGFHLWRLDFFKNKSITWPLFKTCCSAEEGCYTQDLKASNELRKFGFRCAVDTSIKVGHVDMSTGFVW